MESCSRRSMRCLLKYRFHLWYQVPGVNSCGATNKEYYGIMVLRIPLKVLVTNYIAKEEQKRLFKKRFFQFCI